MGKNGKRQRSSGALPDFIIIGTQKGGSSSLYFYMIKHPNIQRSVRKELHFFNKDKHYQKGIDWYKKQFPMPASSNQKKITGEATPNYLFDPNAPKRIAQDLPDTTKFIVLLRNPVDRAYSNYQMRVKKGYDKRSFEEAIVQDENQLEEAFQPVPRKKQKKICEPYVTRGIYVNQLKVWMDLFSRDRFFIIKSEDFYQDPQSTLNEIFRFLNLKKHPINTFRVYNRRKYPPMDPYTRKVLVDYYKPHNQRLYELLGRDFGWDQ